MLDVHSFPGPPADFVKTPEYVFSGGLRYVETYSNVFMGYVKARMKGKTLLEHTTTDYLSYPEGYHE